ncbi:MAG: hypothetical protein ACP5NV_04920 [Candidatus Woesearchaeota archaeon]
MSRIDYEGKKLLEELTAEELEKHLEITGILNEELERFGIEHFGQKNISAENLMGNIINPEYTGKQSIFKNPDSLIFLNFYTSQKSNNETYMDWLTLRKTAVLIIDSKSLKLGFGNMRIDHEYNNMNLFSFLVKPLNGFEGEVLYYEKDDFEHGRNPATGEVFPIGENNVRTIEDGDAIMNIVHSVGEFKIDVKIKGTNRTPYDALANILMVKEYKNILSNFKK